jgi:hypothetical protein
MDNWPKGARIIGPDIGPRPPWAVACIVAEYETDQSDMMTDYFATRTETQVPLAWSRHKRDVFSEMRKAAATFKPTRHLGPGCDVWTVAIVFACDIVANGTAYHKGGWSHWHGELCDRHARQTFTTRAEAEAFVASKPKPHDLGMGSDGVATFEWEIRRESIEHREKYSMGAGYYLKGSMGYSTGWTVSKVSYRLEDIGKLIERRAKPEATTTTGAPAAERGVCPACHAETKPGEQLYRDGSCWPQCLTATRPRLVVEPMYPDATS